MVQNWISVKKYYFKLSSKIWIQDWSILYPQLLFMWNRVKGENIYSLYNNILKRSHVTLTFDLKSLYTLPLCNQCEWSINQVGPSREGRIYGPEYMCYMTLTFDVETDVQTYHLWTPAKHGPVYHCFFKASIYTLWVNKKISIKSHFPWIP